MAQKHITRKSLPSRRKSKQTAQYRVRNWADYNASLVQRGSITIWVSPEIVRAWKPLPDGPRQRGGQVQFSDMAIECLLTVRVVFHLTLRATEGFARSLFEILGVNVAVPDYTTLCNRARHLTVSLPTRKMDPGGSMVVGLA